MSEAIIEGAACKPNISARGRRMRTRFGYVAAAVGLAWLGVSLGLHLPWGFRLLVFMPAAAAATGFLQASRNTCVARAREGMFEHDDLSRTRAPDSEVAASRKVASTILRDSVLIGVVSAAVGGLSTLIVP